MAPPSNLLPTTTQKLMVAVWYGSTAVNSYHPTERHDDSMEMVGRRRAAPAPSRGSRRQKRNVDRQQIQLLLLLLVGASFHHTLAFAPAHTSMSRNCIHRIDKGDDQIFTSTQLWARNKSSANRKVPKMPTLPVSSNRETSDDFYSTSKTISTPMVVMDVENIRGATSFRISHEALLSRIRLWREDRLSIASSTSSSSDDDGDCNLLEPLVWVCDHGLSPSIHHYSLFPNSNDEISLPHNFGAIFSGGRTADDVIVDLVQLRCGGSPSYYNDKEDNDEDDDDYVGVEDGDNLHAFPESAFPESSDFSVMTRNTTIVITGDARLISRCQQARRQGSSLSDVIFVEPASLLQQLERYTTNSQVEESLFGEVSPQASAHRVRVPPPTDGSGKSKDGKTASMISFKSSSIAAQQHAKFQARFQNKEATPERLIEQPQAHTQEVTDNHSYEDEENEDEDEDDHSASIAAQLKTEQIRRQMLLSDAYYLARPSKSRGRKSQSSMAAIHAKYKDRNISKKQQKKLYAKRFGKKRKEDMAEAAMKRKELAAKLQQNLERASKVSLNDGDGQESNIDQSRSVRGGAELLETLLGWFEERRIMIANENISPRLEKAKQDTPISLLGLNTGQVGSDDKFDPLGSVVPVPLRDGQDQSGNSVAPLRMVVISDTHGFEGALSKFSSEEGSHHHSDDFLLPHADVLLHCGDFAASGSRKTQRAAARRLDEFLARQTHIPEKIVVQGNHDPDSTSKVLFPSSKAIYVRSSSTITVNGVHIALEPFSRRMAYRTARRQAASASTAASSFPKCDILVSHEPPKGLLDLTYHGFSAGSFYLKDLVERAEHKPRLWLCGHIHESRGIVTKKFQSYDSEEGESDSTIVINASNANSGRANRIVSGAVVVEVERLSSKVDVYQSAESTLQSRTVDFDDYLVSSPTNGDLTLAGIDGMELNDYVSRPGVRRRKGLPLSVRQKMKQVRSTLVQSQNEST